MSNPSEEKLFEECLKLRAEEQNPCGGLLTSMDLERREKLRQKIRDHTRRLVELSSPDPPQEPAVFPPA